MTSYKFFRSTKTLMLASLVLALSVFVFGTKKAAAITDNFPAGHSVYNEWVLLSQYKCPGHCLDTPRADIRVFYRISTLDNEGVGNNDLLQVTVQTLCRYVGTPDGYAEFVGSGNGTIRNGWPNLDCTGVNTANGSTLSTFSIQRDRLNCNQSGTNDKYPGWCYADLNMRVNDDANHPIVGVWVNTADGLGSVKISAQEMTAPTQGYPNTNCFSGAGGSCSPSGGPPNNNNLFALWNNYANNGPETHHNWDLTFAPDCTIKSNQTTYLRWYDADDGGSGNNGTQSGQISFDLIQRNKANGNTNTIFNNRSNLGGNDSFRDLSFTMRPNHEYTWRWNNVSATNGIQLWIPASEIGSRIDCPPPPGIPPPGTTPSPGFAACVVESVSNSSPWLGQSVNIVVRFENHSEDTDWFTSPYLNSVQNSGLTRDKQHSGVLLETGEDEPLASRTEGQPLVAGDRLMSINHNTPNYDWKTTRTFTVSNTDPNVRSATYNFGIRNDVTDAYFASAPNNYSLCNVTLPWEVVRITQYGCTTTEVTNPGNLQFYLVFYDAAGNVVHNTGFDAGAPYSGSPSWNTFNDFTYLYPHSPFYTVVVYQWGSNAELARETIPQCMAAACQGSLAADLEPGETGSISYGLLLSNFTSRTFNGDYSIQATTAPGLSGSGTTAINMAPGGPTAYNTTFNMTANYTGTVAAHLLFGAANIDSALTIDCPVTYTPESRPTLSITNGDVSAGGAFKYQGSVCPALTTTFSNGRPRYISPNSVGSGNNSGGIRTFARPNAFRGSGADFAAYALGYINGAAGGPAGFFSSGLTTNGAANYASLMFANNTSNGTNLGGLLGGQFTNAHCAPDYFAKRANATTRPENVVNVDDPTLGTGQYYYPHNITLTGGVAPLGAKTVDRGQKLTIFVDGDVNLSTDILYDTWNFDPVNHTNNAPYFALIVRGNIYVNSSQTVLNGLFVAQPRDDGSKGEFYTCAVGAGAPTASQVGPNCQTKLVIKGSVIAQHVYPIRAGDTLFQYANPGSASDVFNFTSSMVISNPNLPSSSGGAATPTPLDSINSRPPVF